MKQLVLKASDIWRLDVEMGNTVAMQKGDTLYQLATEIHNLSAKHSECESKIWGSDLGEQDERPHIQFEHLE